MGTTLAKIKAGAKTHFRNSLSTGKNVALCMGVGVGGYYGSKELVPRVEFLQKNWYGVPLVMAGIGYYLRNKKPLIAGALLGAAGYVGAASYDVKTQNEKANQNKPPQPNAAALVDAVFDDRRSFGGYGDSDAGAFVEVSPDQLREMLRAA